jgi:hypothetical protein
MPCPIPIPGCDFPWRPGPAPGSGLRRAAQRVAALALAGCVGLAGCGTPQERCARGVEARIAALDRKIAETESALARGTRWGEQQMPVLEYRPCGSSKTGFCRTVGTTRVPVERPIDPDAERAQLTADRAERAALQDRRAADLAACAAPEPGRALSELRPGSA